MSQAGTPALLPALLPRLSAPLSLACYWLMPLNLAARDGPMVLLSAHFSTAPALRRADSETAGVRQGTLGGHWHFLHHERSSGLHQGAGAAPHCTPRASVLQCMSNTASEAKKYRVSWW